MLDFKPFILPEEPVPPFAIACQQCELSKQRHRVIWGEGNPNAPVFILLDNPGSREDREGQPFVCGTRETLQYGMREAGLDIDSVYVSYLLKCRPIRAYNKPLAREACFSHLQLQLKEKRPDVLFALGNVVVQTLFPDQEADVKSYRGKWHTFQEMPIAVSYHPLAVRRRPVLMKYFVEDIKFVAEKIKDMI
ncbi:MULTISPECIES: uracil-DNA glycosylase [unclassified Paenibacillus]|uniref:uracil-DNA glycosylase n=1 Tax=unclassified Paenibacillus TaxID=185978 RepID=UPI001AE78A4C|nr:MULTISPECIES: uracil-DNA glycosylase [unclassified Paenibacillus]MBP1156682.1 DNA polymerase [Paenibacillus sp. PvP091]MBP1172580.1 DNA polymerase [Paenibacillus sp. PvR098]MBP2438960.1 DNA polymerase [Paenibacillus sp. PvP052]